MSGDGRPAAVVLEAESRYRELLELLPDAAVVHSHGRIRYCNSEALRMLGVSSREELERQPVLTFLHPDERARALELGWRIREDPRPVQRQQTRFLRRDGSVVYAEVSLAPVRYESREALLVIMRDVTEEREAALALRRSEARLAEALAAVNEGVWEMNLVTGETYRSDRIATMLGYEPHEFPGNTVEGWMELLHPEDRERSVSNFMEHLAGASPSHFSEVRMRARSGEWQWMMLRGRVVEYDAVGRPMRAVGTQTDFSERRLLEQRLRQAQKMEAVGQLAGGVAHDFNNLFTAILGNLELAMSQLPEESPVREELTDATRAAARASAITRKLLSFSRIQALPPATVSANVLVRDAERLMRRTIGSGITTTVDLDPASKGVRGDPVQLEQMLLNLLINARDAMPQGGALTLSTEAVELAPSESAPLGVAPGSYVRITVRDTGIGMDADTRSRVFEPFFTTKRAGEGTGLGLAQVYGAATASGGTVTVQGRAGEGSTFTIYLPRVETDAAATLPEAAPPSGRGELVLVAEDEESVRATTRRLLERNGYRVIEARHGREALLHWREHRTEVAVVLTDVRMPEMDGAQLAAALRAEDPGVRLLFMSGYARGVTDGGEIIAAGEAFLEKPFSSERLLTLLREVLDDGRVSAGLA